MGIDLIGEFETIWSSMNIKQPSSEIASKQGEKIDIVRCFW